MAKLSLLRALQERFTTFEMKALFKQFVYIYTKAMFGTPRQYANDFVMMHCMICEVGSGFLEVT